MKPAHKASWLAASAIGGDQEAAIATLYMVLMKVLFTSGLAFTGNAIMGLILFDQSRLYPAGQSGEAAPVPVALTA